MALQVEAFRDAFIGSAVERLRQQTDRIVDCLGKLDDGQIWSRGNESSNSIGNIVVHLVGNLGQWVLHGLWGGEDLRDRDAEFAARLGPGKVELAQLLTARVDEVIDSLKAIPSERLLEMVQPQGYRLPVMEVVTHITEHFYYHGGQILLLTKLYLDQDLGYYRHLAGNRKEHAESVP